MTETAFAILNQYPPEKFNVLAPETMTSITPWHQVTISKVKIDPRIQSGEKSNGQVYMTKGKLALHKESLQRLADAAGIRFKATKLTRYEDGSFEANVTAEKQDPDGTWRQFPGSYYWDVTERVANVRDPNSQTGKEDIRMIRTFSAQRAETGAMSRAIRCILPIKQAYTAAELGREFIVARVVFNPWQDPVIAAAVRQALAVKLAYNTGLLHGPDGGDDPLGIESGPVAPAVSKPQVAAANEILSLVGGQPTGANSQSSGIPWGELGETEDGGDDGPDAGDDQPDLDDVFRVEAPTNVPTGKTAAPKTPRVNVRTGQWNQAAITLATNQTYYQSDGQPNFYKMLNAAHKHAGVSEITDANLADVIAALTAHAVAEMEIQPGDVVTE